MIRPLEILTLALLGLVALAPPLLAQTSGRDGDLEQRAGEAVQEGRAKHGPKQAKKRRRLAAVKRRVLEERVGLTSEEAEAVLKLFVEREKERRALQRRLRQANAALRKLVVEDDADDAAYAAALDDLSWIRSDLHAQRQAQLDALEKLLSPRKRARLLSTLRVIQRRMKRSTEN